MAQEDSGSRSLSVGADGPLCVRYGNERAVGFEGTLKDAHVEEHASKQPNEKRSLSSDEVPPKTQSKISKDLIRAYRETDYRIGEGPNAITLRIDERSEALSRLYDTSSRRCALCITAYNPFSETRSVEANLAAHARLRAELSKLTQYVIEGAGAHPLGTWPEEKSFLALGISLETAQALGNQFGQNAIVWVGDDLIPRLVLLR